MKYDDPEALKDESNLYSGMDPEPPAVETPTPVDEAQVKQVGSIVKGPGAKREERMKTPAKLSVAQQDIITNAKKFAMDQSVKSVLLKQNIVHQQQVTGINSS